MLCSGWYVAACVDLIVFEWPVICPSEQGGQSRTTALFLFFPIIIIADHPCRSQLPDRCSRCGCTKYPGIRTLAQQAGDIVKIWPSQDFLWHQEDYLYSRHQIAKVRNAYQESIRHLLGAYNHTFTVRIIFPRFSLHKYQSCQNLPNITGRTVSVLVWLRMAWVTMQSTSSAVSTYPELTRTPDADGDRPGQIAFSTCQDCLLMFDNCRIRDIRKLPWVTIVLSQLISAWRCVHACKLFPW